MKHAALLLTLMAALALSAFSAVAQAQPGEACTLRLREYRHDSKTYYYNETCLPKYERVCHERGQEFFPGSRTYYIIEICREERVR